MQTTAAVPSDSETIMLKIQYADNLSSRNTRNKFSLIWKRSQSHPSPNSNFEVLVRAEKTRFFGQNFPQIV